MIDRIVCIVEGKGEVDALPVLLRRLLIEIDPTRHCEIPRPNRRNRSSLVRSGEFEREIQTAAQFAGQSSLILVLIDADDDKACELGPELTKRAKLARPDRPILVSLAHMEFEHWLVAADPSRPPNFESIRNAKRLLREDYSPTAHQARLTATFDLDLARQHSRSFRRFCTRFRELLSA